MFANITGIVEEKFNNSVVLNVGGVGFFLDVTKNSFDEINEIGQTDKLYTYLVVREDNLKLLGFKSKEERNLFLKLIDVTGVGPKAALQILSGGSLSFIASSIISKNASALSKIKGVGIKTAERIVLELREKLIKQGDFIAADENNIVSNEMSLLPSFALDACLGLESLGLSKKESENLVKNVYTINDKTAEEIIAKALRRL